MEDFIIQYQGFSPSTFARNYVRDVITKLQEEAPSSSFIRVTISKVGSKAFRGILRISSPSGPVFALASAETLTEVSHILIERTRRQLEKWKSRRFNHETIRRPFHLVPKHQWSSSEGGGRDENDSQAG